MFSLKLLRNPYKFRLKVSTGCILHCLTLHGSLLEVLVHWLSALVLCTYTAPPQAADCLVWMFLLCFRNFFGDLYCCLHSGLSAFWAVCLADNVYVVAECILYCLLGRRAIHSGISCWYHSRLSRGKLKLMLTIVVTSQEFDLNANSQTDVGKYCTISAPHPHPVTH